MPSDALRIEEITDLAGLQSISAEWEVLARGDLHATPFQSPEWLVPWWKHVGEGQLFTLAMRAGNRLVGLLPMYIYRHPENRQRQLLLLGAGTSDYLGGTFQAEYRRAAVAAALAHIANSTATWDIARFFQLRRDSDLLTYAQEHEQQALRESDPCMIVELPSRAALPAKIRTNMRNYRRKAEKENSLRLALATGDTAVEQFNFLLKFHLERWESEGEAGVLTQQRVQQHHREALPLLHRRGYLRLYTLLHGIDVLAVLYALVDPTDRPQRTAYLYLMGFDSQGAAFGPGTLMYDFVVDACNAEGINRFDLLRGEENYKHLWGATPQATFSFALHAKPGQHVGRP